MPTVFFDLFKLSAPVRFARVAGLTVILMCFHAQGLAQQTDMVKHTVSFPDDRQQVFQVRSEFPVNAATTELKMPSWTPGSYLIRDFAANVNRLTTSSVDGEMLNAEKVSKDRWLVSTGNANTLVLQYEVFTPNLNVRESWASREFSLINGASVFMYTDISRNQPQLVTIISSEERGDVFSALPRQGPGSGFLAENYDELVDGPIAIAPDAPSYRFTLENQEYVLLNIGENAFWDGRQAAQDVEKIVGQTQWFWQVNPLERPYWFMNFITGTGGGLEHDHSTVLMTGHMQMRSRKSYIKWLGLVAHEFFHVWNVRRMRPLGLADINYQEIHYTGQLWLAEGLSSYYDNLLLARAGLVTFSEYLELLAADIYRLESTPGRLEQSVTEASFDTWIRHYQPNANTLNSTISYYTKGALIGFVLDAYLRKESRGRHDLDEVMRKMYGRYSNTPYDENAFRKIVAEISGSEAGEFVQSVLNTTEELNFDDALSWYGLEILRAPETAASEPVEDLSVSGLGVVWETGKAGLVVKTVLAGSAGEAAGLMPQDEVLAIGDNRLTTKTRDKLMSSYRPGEKTRLLVSRRGRILSLDITLGTAIVDNYVIRLRSEHRPKHIKRLERLLGQKIR